MQLRWYIEFLMHFVHKIMPMMPQKCLIWNVLSFSARSCAAHTHTHSNTHTCMCILLYMITMVVHLV